MQSQSLMLLLIVSIFFITLFGNTNGKKMVMICPHLTGEPTVSEIVTNLLPNNAIPAPNALYSLHEHGVNVSSLVNSVDQAMQLSFPIVSLVSDGQFTISYASANNLYTFNDVHFVYKQSIVMKYLCLMPYIYLGSICDCDGNIEHVDAHTCMKSALCSDKTVTEGQCNISLSPFDDKCLMITLNSEVDADSESLIQRSVQYKRITPTVYDLWHSFTNYITKSSSNSSFDRSDKATMNLIIRDIDIYVKPILECLPLYLVRMLLGYSIVANSADLTDNPVVQLLMQAIYGLFFAFILLAYMVYSTSKRVMGRYGGPLAEIAHIPLSVSFLSIALVNRGVLHVFLRALLAFWETGYPFGLPWAGKAYFSACILLSVGVSRYFALFQSDSFSWSMMHKSIKLVGLVLLGYGTSSTLLAVVLVVLGVFDDHIRHWLWLMYLSSHAISNKPTYKYLSQGKMTNEEVKQLSRTHTQRALEELGAHLSKNPEQLNLHMDRLREDGKKEEAQLLQRFAHGQYGGVPYTVRAEEEEVRNIAVYWYIASVVVVGSVVVGMYWYYTQRIVEG